MIATSVQRSINAAKGTRVAAKEAVKVGKASVKMARQTATGDTISYAATAARATTLAGIVNTSLQNAPVQLHRQSTHHTELTSNGPALSQQPSHVKGVIAQDGDRKTTNNKVEALKRLSND